MILTERSSRLLHGQPRQPFEWNYFPLLTGRIVLSNKTRNLRKYSVFLSIFQKKSYLADPIYRSHNLLLQILHGLTSLDNYILSWSREEISKNWTRNWAPEFLIKVTREFFAPQTRKELYIIVPERREF